MRKGVVKPQDDETFGNQSGVDPIVDGMCFEDILACYIVFKTYKDDETYKCYLTNVMFDSIFNIKFKSKPDMIINTSCEHMFPMTRFKKLKPSF